MNTQEVISKANTIVIKIGTALIVDENGEKTRQDWLNALAEDIAALKNQGKNVVIVSSGAVALGRTSLGIALDTPPQDIPLEKKQASSSIGQFHVFNGFHRAFEKQDIGIAQVLLTMSETENRRMYLNARATLGELLSAGIIPIINENDTISTGEIRFGDNDRLAARVAQMVEADVVVLLSTTDGLYTLNPDKNDEAEHIPLLESISDEHHEMAGEAVPGMSTGGMKSKVEAAYAATSSGIHLVIGQGTENHALKSLIEDKSTRTTLFLATNTKNNAKKRWIGAHLNPKGIIIVDEGALSALQSGKSLLPVGVYKIEGQFERGDIVEIYSMDRQKLGMGVSAYKTNDAQKLKGKNSQEIAEILGYAGRSELIHRNDMVLQD